MGTDSLANRRLQPLGHPSAKGKTYQRACRAVLQTTRHAVNAGRATGPRRKPARPAIIRSRMDPLRAVATPWNDGDFTLPARYARIAKIFTNI